MAVSLNTLTMNEPLIFLFCTQNHGIIPLLIITVASLGGNCSQVFFKGKQCAENSLRPRLRAQIRKLFWQVLL